MRRLRQWRMRVNSRSATAISAWATSIASITRSTSATDLAASTPASQSAERSSAGSAPSSTIQAAAPTTTTFTTDLATRPSAAQPNIRFSPFSGESRVKSGAAALA
jgi:hypothetical protein